MSEADVAETTDAEVAEAAVEAPAEETEASDEAGEKS